MVTTTQLDVRPMTGAIGAEIFGVDLSADLDDATIAAIRRALLDHCVVFFRDQDITDDEQVRFATRFSVVQRAVFGNTSDVAPDLTVIDMLTPKGSGTDVWHADSTFMPAPPFGAVLRAVQIPEVGGDTCFASMYAAYDALSPRMQKQLDGLTAVHSTAHVMDLVRRLDNAKVPTSADDLPTHVHPVVRVHPETGRKLLYVSPNWVERIVELQEAESAALTRVPLRAREVARVPVPLPLAGALGRVLGQPGVPALRRRRLRRAPRHAPGAPRGRRSLRPGRRRRLIQPGGTTCR